MVLTESVVPRTESSETPVTVARRLPFAGRFPGLTGCALGIDKKGIPVPVAEQEPSVILFQDPFSQDSAVGGIVTVGPGTLVKRVERNED